MRARAVRDMRFTVAVLLAVLACGAAASAAVPATPTYKPRAAEASSAAEESSAVEHGIRGVLDAQVAAWNRGDLAGFMQGYWRSHELTFYSGGTVSTGWDAALARYQHRY